jgi:hypothetical protein
MPKIYFLRKLTIFDHFTEEENASKYSRGEIGDNFLMPL